MKSIRDIGCQKSITRNKVIPLSLGLAFVILVISTSPFSSLQFVKPAMAAGTLTSISIVPTNNLVNLRSTYDIFLKTSTTGTIKTIEMTFPVGFDLSAANIVIERAGIGSGSLSSSGSTLKYTVNSPESVPAGTNIRFEIGKIINSGTAGSFKVTFETRDPNQLTIDGPTLSGSFPIKDITGNDVSPSFMIRKTLKDDDAGHAQGWNPNNAQVLFFVKDSDIDLANSDSTFVSIMTQLDINPVCSVVGTGTTGINEPMFEVRCNIAPQENTQLHYIISKLPPHLIGSSASASASPITSPPTTSSTISSPFSSLGEQ